MCTKPPYIKYLYPIYRSNYSCPALCCAQSCLTVTPQAVAHKAPLSVGFSRQEYWSGLPCPPPGDLPDPGIEPASLASPALAGRFFTTVEAKANIFGVFFLFCDKHSFCILTF